MKNNIFLYTKSVGVYINTLSLYFLATQIAYNFSEPRKDD
jgi:hypothetical protein